MMQHPFLTMIEQHSAAIDRVCRSFAHTAEDREDLRQDIVLNLWRGWARYRPTARGVTWVWRVAVNTGISWRRHRGRQIQTISIDDEMNQHDSFFAVGNPSHNEQVDHLRELVSLLPTKEQQLIGLYLDGWQHDEIACMLGISLTNVQTRLSRIRKHLKEINDKIEHRT